MIIQEEPHGDHEACRGEYLHVTENPSVLGNVIPRNVSSRTDGML